MTDRERKPVDYSSLDDDFALSRLLRQHYAAPDDPGYWMGLERSIMGRINATPPAAGTLDLLAGWSRAGLIAAGVAGLIASAAVWRVRDAEARGAFETVFRDSSPAVAAVQTPESESPAAREVTLRYVIATP